MSETYGIYDGDGHLVDVKEYDDTNPDAMAEALAEDLSALRRTGKLVGQYEIQPQTHDD